MKIPGLASRLNQLVDILGQPTRADGHKIYSFAKSVGIQKSSIAGWLDADGKIKDEIDPKLSLIIRIANNANVNLEWILTGEGPIFQEDTKGKVTVIDDRRAFNRTARLSEEDCKIVAEWLAKDERSRDLLVQWARMRLDEDHEELDITGLAISMIRAKMSAILENYEDWKRRKEKIASRE